mgnify:CR=1 FL=1
MDGLPRVRDNVVLHKGWFNDTLPPFLDSAGRDLPAAFLHLDADIFESTWQGAAKAERDSNEAQRRERESAAQSEAKVSEAARARDAGLQSKSIFEKVATENS